MAQSNWHKAVALDVGARRIGVAAASMIARLPRTVGYVYNDDAVWDSLRQIIADEQADVLVVGLPRNMRGEETDQTQVVRQFAAQAEQALGLPIVWQDETLTSKKAEAELAARGQIHDKGDVDALAALYILEDYMSGLKG